MKQYIFCSLILFELIGCTSTTKLIKDNNKTLENNKSTININNTLIINLDKKLKKDYTKGGLIDDKTIPIDISEYQNINDEVKFTGKILQKIKTIKFTRKRKSEPNDEVSFDGKELKIKTAKLNDEDTISLIDKDKKILVKILIRTY